MFFFSRTNLFLVGTFNDYVNTIIMMIDLPHITLSLFFRVITWCLLFQGEVRYIHALIKLI